MINLDHHLGFSQVCDALRYVLVNLSDNPETG